MTRRLQFSLRGLLILMFGVACFFGGVVFKPEILRRAQRAVDPPTFERRAVTQQPDGTWVEEVWREPTSGPASAPILKPQISREQE